MRFIFTESQNKASDKVVALILENIAENQAIHAETAISSACRLAGSSLFRTLKFYDPDLFKPGSSIFSDEADEKGPALVSLLGGILKSNGFDIDSSKMKEASYFKSRLTFLESMERFLFKANEIRNEFGISDEDFSYACVLSAAKLMLNCKNIINNESSFSLAVYSLVEGMKTAPPKV